MPAPFSAAATALFGSNTQPLGGGPASESRRGPAQEVGSHAAGTATQPGNISGCARTVRRRVLMSESVKRWRLLGQTWPRRRRPVRLNQGMKRRRAISW